MFDQFILTGISELVQVLLEIGSSRLRTSADSHWFARIVIRRRTQLVQMSTFLLGMERWRRAREREHVEDAYVKASHEKTNTEWTASVTLSRNLTLYDQSLVEWKKPGDRVLLLLTWSISRVTGIGLSNAYWWLIHSVRMNRLKNTIHIGLLDSRGSIYLSIRASDARPAMETPIWSSMYKIFFWWAESSDGARYASPKDNVTICAFVRTKRLLWARRERHESWISRPQSLLLVSLLPWHTRFDRVVPRWSLMNDRSVTSSIDSLEDSKCSHHDHIDYETRRRESKIETRDLCCWE